MGVLIFGIDPNADHFQARPEQLVDAHRDGDSGVRVRPVAEFLLVGFAAVWRDGRTRLTGPQAYVARFYSISLRPHRISRSVQRPEKRGERAALQTLRAVRRRPQSRSAWTARAFSTAFERGMTARQIQSREFP